MLSVLPQQLCALYYTYFVMLQSPDMLLELRPDMLSPDMPMVPSLVVLLVLLPDMLLVLSPSMLLVLPPDMLLLLLLVMRGAASCNAAGAAS